MNLELAEQIANAVLYEGYMLYPYRPSSVKNRQRWTFGGIYPHAYHMAQRGTEPWTMHTECIATGNVDTTLDIRIRFLQLQDRTIGQLQSTETGEISNTGAQYITVPAMRVGEKLYQSWQEAVERNVVCKNIRLSELQNSLQRQDFNFPGTEETEEIRDPAGQQVGLIVREQRALSGAVEIKATELETGVFRIAVTVLNMTALEEAGSVNRDEASMWAFVSTHALLTIGGGAFVSMTDPPERYRDAAASCRNVGTWPILVGEEGEHDILLLSPIILYDYPQIAQESPGDLFDGTEIDEILTLRILTLTDEEKSELRQSDWRAGAMLDRTEALTADDMMKLHGTVRSPQTPRGGRGIG